MRRLIIIMIAVFLCGGGAIAQDSMRTDHVPQTYITMKKGHLLEKYLGRTRRVRRNVTLVNGTTIHRNGVINESSGKTKHLKEGQYITMDGRIGWLKVPNNAAVRK